MQSLKLGNDMTQQFQPMSDAHASRSSVVSIHKGFERNECKRYVYYV